MLASDTYVVTTLADVSQAGTANDNEWSLREALIHSAADADGIDQIQFSPELAGQTILLGDADGDGLVSGVESASELLIDSNVVIDGSAAEGLTISGGDATRVFKLADDAGLDVTISDLAIIKGYYVASNTTYGHGGAGVQSIGNDLKLKRVELSGHESTATWYGKGAAVYSRDGDLTINESYLHGNTAYYGAGVAFEASSSSPASLTINGSTLADNFTKLNSSSVPAVHTRGGGIYLAGDSTTASIANTTISGNDSHGGAGVWSASTNSSTTVLNSTIYGNHTGYIAAGVNNDYSSHQFTLHNSIVAGNTGGQHWSREFRGHFNTSSSHNLVLGTSSAGPLVNGQNGNQVGVDPLLSGLAFNGGVTPTHAPLPNSPVLDAGNDTLVFTGTDQRGATRVVDLGDPDGNASYVDLGAYERQVSETIVVDTLTDGGSSNPGEVTLRDALAWADALAGPDTIRFDAELFASSNPEDPPFSVARTLVLGDTDGDGVSDTMPGQLAINSEVTIDGPGSGLLTIDAKGNSRVIEIAAGAATSLQDLTITGGLTSSAYGGGAIRSQGDLTLERMVFTGNEATNEHGGAVRSYGGDLKIYDSTFDDNLAKTGGGIYYQSYSGDELIVSRSTISNNSVTGNGASGLYIYAFGGGATATIENSTFSGNVGKQGGAIRIQGNESHLNVNIVNSTIAYNEATDRFFPAGLWDNTGTGVTTLTNSIVAHNQDDSDGPYIGAYDLRGHITGTHNVIGDVTIAGFTGGVDDNVVIDVDAGDTAGLMLLDHYGGYAKTHNLTHESVAIDIASAAATTSSGDQRGDAYNRTYGPSPDAGSIESQVRSEGDILHIYGTDTDDTITVSSTEITFTGAYAQVVDVAKYEELSILGGMGDDDIRIDNDLYLLATIDGQGGDDTLQGGPLSDSLVGGEGNDYLLASLGQDSLVYGQSGGYLRTIPDTVRQHVPYPLGKIDKSVFSVDPPHANGSVVSNTLELTFGSPFATFSLAYPVSAAAISTDAKSVTLSGPLHTVASSIEAIRVSFDSGYQPGDTLPNLGLDLPHFGYSIDHEYNGVVPGDPPLNFLGGSYLTGNSFIFFELGAYSEGVATGDFDGDGNLDVLDFAPDAGVAVVRRGTASGEEYTSAWLQDASLTSEALVAADLNGDGRDDVLIRDNVSGELSLWRSESTLFDSIPLLDHSQTAISASNWDDDLTFVGDFDADGSEEVVSWNSNSAKWEMLQFDDALGAHLEEWGGQFHGDIPSNSTVHVGDSNRDGRDDLIVKGSDDGWRVALSQPSNGGEFLGQNWGNWFEKAGASSPDGATLDPDLPYAALIDTFKSVYDTVELELYNGFLKGAQGAENSGKGNAYDQAAYLEERLESLGFTTQLVVGTATASWEEVRDWIGAPEQLADSRTRVRNILNIYDSSVADSGDNDLSFGHAWVTLDAPTAAGMNPITLDPSWKFKDRQPGLVRNGGALWRGWNYRDALALNNTDPSSNANIYVEDLGSPVDAYAVAVTQALIDSNEYGFSSSDVAYDGPIRPWTATVLPYEVVGSTPATVEGKRFDDLTAVLGSATDSEAYAHRVEIALSRLDTTGGIDETSTSAGVLVPTASPDAEGILINYSGDIPQLRVGAAMPTDGPSIGVDENLVVETTSYAPGQNSSTAASELTSYEYAARRHDTVAVGIGVNQHGSLSLAQKAEQLQTTLSIPDVSEIPDFLHYTLDLLLDGIYESHERVSGLTNSGLVSDSAYVAIASSTGAFNTDIGSAGFAPFNVAPEGLSINAGDTSQLFRLSNWQTLVSNQQIGHLLSTERAYLENAVIEEVIAAEGISSLKAAQRSVRDSTLGIIEYWYDANITINLGTHFDTGDRISYRPWTYNNGSWSDGQGNSNSLDFVDGPGQFGQFVSALLNDTQLGASREDGARYAAEIVSTLQNSAEQQTFVWVPRSSASIGDWNGNSYSVSGAASGKSFYAERLFETDSVASEGGASSDDSSFASSLAFPSNLSRSSSGGISVDPTSGAARLTERDIQLASVGVPLDFVRYYSSQNDEHVGLGVGWSHSFSDRLVDAGGSGMEPDLEWVDSRGARHLFTYDNTDGYQTPSELFGTLEFDAVNDEYVFLADDGMRTRFEKAGLSPTTQDPTVARLKSKLTLGKDGYELTYVSAASTRIAEVRDVHFNTGRKLDFSYNLLGYIETITKHDFQDTTALENGVSSNIGTWEYVYDTLTASQLETVKSPTDTHITTSLKTDYAYYDSSAPTKIEGKLKRVTDPNDVPIDLAYYPSGLVQKVINEPDGSEPSAMRYRYNLIERRTTITDENGSSESVLYNENGLVTRVIHADGSQRSTEWGVTQSGEVAAGTEYLTTSQTNELGARGKTDYYLDLSGTDAFKNRHVKETVNPQFYHSNGTLRGAEQVTTTYDYVQAGGADYNHAVLPQHSSAILAKATPREAERETFFFYDDEGRLERSTSIEIYVGAAGTQSTTEYEYFDDDTHRNNLVSDVHSGAGRSEDDGKLKFLTLFEDIEVVASADGLGALAVTLLGASDSATKRLYADAVRVYRVGDSGDTAPFDGNPLDVLDIRTIDDSDAISFSTSGTTSSGAEQSSAYGDSAFGDTVTELDPGATATWTFSDLVPGRYRIAVSLDRDPAGDSDFADYEVLDGSGNLLGSALDVRLANPLAVEVYTNRQQSFAYDAAGRVTQTSVEGIPVGFSSYDPNGNLLESIDRTGVRTGGEYDVLGRRQAAFQGDAASSVEELTTTYSYDAARLQSMTDALDRQTTYGYDNRGRLTTTTNAFGETVTQQFDDAGNLTASTDALGNTTEYSYDARNRRVQMIHPDGAVETTFYDAVGRIRRQVDALGHATDFEYDAAGNPVRTKRYLIEDVVTTTVETTNVWDGFGNLLQTIDPEGHVSQTYYNGRGQAIKTLVYDEDLVPSQSLRDTLSLKTLSPSDKPVVFSTSRYNIAGELVETRAYDTAAITEAGASFNPTLLSPMGSGDSEYWQEVQFAYDSFGRRTDTTLIDASAIDGEADPRARSIYDSAGRIRYQIDELGRVTELTYDEYGRAEETILPDPTPDNGSDNRPRTTNSYDAVGNLVTVVDANGGVATTEYDSLNRPIATTNPEGETTRTLYDKAGRLVASVDARGYATHTVYDSRGRVAQNRSVDPDGDGDRVAAVTRFRYDAAGRLTEETDALGYTTTHEYDTLNRRDATSVVVSLTADDRDGSFSYSGDATVTDSGAAYSNTLTSVGAVAPAEPAVASWTFDNLVSGDYRVYLAIGSVAQIVSATVRVDDDPQIGLDSIPLNASDAVNAVARYDQGRVSRWIELTDATSFLQVPPDSTAEIRIRSLPGGSILADAVRVERIEESSTLYDLNDNPKDTTDLKDRTTTRQYDELNRLIVETLPDAGNGSLSTESHYDGYGNITQTVEKHAGIAYRTTEYEYDVRNRLIRETLDKNGIDEVATRFEYDDAGRLIRQINAAGTSDEVISEYRYDDLDRVAEERIDVVPQAGEPAPNVRAGDATQLTTYGYDALGNRTRTKVFGVLDDPASQPTNEATWLETTSVYDKANRLVSTTSEGFRYNANNDPIALPGDASTDRFWYDANGVLIAQSDATNIVTTYELDRLGRTVATVSSDPDGDGPKDALRTEFAYDPIGNLTEENIVVGLPGDNETARSFYDSLGRLVRSIDGEGHVTLSSYDAVGNLISYTDPLHNETTYEHDNLDRLVRETDSLNQFRLYTYDDRGRLATIVDRNGRERRFTEYDNLDRLLKEEWGYPDRIPVDLERDATHTIEWQYDLLGRVLKATEYDVPTADTYTDTYAYDNLGRLTSQSNHDLAQPPSSSQNPHVTQSWQYDDPAVNSYHEMVHTASAVGFDGATSQSYTTAYRYDRPGRLHEITDTSNTIRNFDFEYDTAYRPISMIVSENAFTLTTGYGYDAIGRLASINHLVGGAPITSLTYGYDDASRIDSIDSVYAHGQVDFSRSHSYTYDNAGQLVDANAELAPGTTGPYVAIDSQHQYDDNGNDENQGTFSPANRLTNDGQFRYGYDAEGNLVYKQEIVAAGASEGATTEYAWDHRNRLIEVREYNSPPLIVTDSATQVSAFNGDVSGGSWAIANDGAAIQLTGGVAIAIDLQQFFGADYTLTPDTVIEFDYIGRAYEDDQGDLDVTFGFDDDLFLSNSWGRQILLDADSDIPGAVGIPNGGRYNEREGSRRYRIRLREEVLASNELGSMRYLFFKSRSYAISDGRWTAQFSNIHLYEQPTTTDPLGPGEQYGGMVRQTRYRYSADDLRVQKSITDSPGLVREIQFNRLPLDTDYWGVTQGGAVEVLDGGETLRLENGISRIIELPRDYYATENTTLSFWYRSGATEASHRVAIGFDEVHQSDFRTDRLVHIDGPQPNGLRVPLAGKDYSYYVDSAPANESITRGDWKQFTIRLGDVGISSLLLNRYWDHLVISHDDQSGQQVEAFFKGLVVYEADELSASGTSLATVGHSNSEHYIYTGDQQTMVLGDSGQVQRRRVYGTQQDQLLLEEVFNDLGGSTTQYPLTDHLGTVHGVLDSSGQLLQHIDYDNHGQIVQLLDGVTGNPLVSGGEVDLDQLATDVAFAGREWDNDAGLYYNRNRWYDAESGRFISEDPLGFADGPNPYRYAGNDPVNYRDPSGLTGEANSYGSWLTDDWLTDGNSWDVGYDLYLEDSYNYDYYLQDHLTYALEQQSYEYHTYNTSYSLSGPNVYNPVPTEFNLYASLLAEYSPEVTFANNHIASLEQDLAYYSQYPRPARPSQNVFSAGTYGGTPAPNYSALAANAAGQLEFYRAGGGRNAARATAESRILNEYFGTPATTYEYPSYQADLPEWSFQTDNFGGIVRAGTAAIPLGFLSGITLLSGGAFLPATGLPIAFLTDQYQAGLRQGYYGGSVSTVGGGFASYAATSLTGYESAGAFAELGYDVVGGYLSGGGVRGAFGRTSSSLTRGAQLRQSVGGQFDEYMHFRGQGFTPAQAKYLTQPYGNRAGHHFPIPQRTGRDWSIPKSVIDSRFNVLRPDSISIGRFYELHYRVDSFFHGTRFPRAIGGTWRGSQLGLERATGLERLWLSTPAPTKAGIGVGAGTGAAAAGYWWFSSD